MKINWRVYFGIILVAISALLYLAHYYEFHDLHHIELYGLGDLAFLPIEVLLVVLVVDWAISEQEKRSQITKLNMVIGIYFSEVGTALLKAFSNFDPNVERIRDELLVRGTWTTRDFTEASMRLNKHKYKLVYEKDDPKALQFLQNLRSFLISQRGFLLRLLENPNLLEQEAFTEQLWAVFHLADELYYRPELTALPNSDYRHLAVDAQRAYSALTSEWLKYMAYLLKRYPYLFSLALRTNPFDPSASPIIKDAG
ncbi:MAG: hypothetical protein ACXV2B_07260 [Halobacteriota archaeon]